MDKKVVSNLNCIDYVKMLTRIEAANNVNRFDILLHNISNKFPKRTALVYKSILLSFEVLDGWTNAIARTLVDDFKIKKNGVIALTAKLCPESFIVYLAILRAGAIVTPINPTHVERDIEYQIKDSGAIMAIASNDKFDVVNALKEKNSNVKNTMWFGEPNNQLDIEKNIFYYSKDKCKDYFEVSGVNVDDVAAIPYSSGTTGLPKGVMLTHSNLLANACQFVNSYNISDCDTIINGIPLLINLHIGASIISGAKMILLDRLDSGYVLSIAKKYEATSLLTIVPVVNGINKLPNLEEYSVPSLKFINVGASNLSKEVAKNVSKRLGTNVVQGFGSQETSALTHALPIPLFDGMIIPEGSCGILVSGTEHIIVDPNDSNKRVPVGEPGELLVKGPQVMKGYWNNEEKTKSVLFNGWYCTGDIVKEDENGIIYFVSRKKDVIKSEGHTISPFEIESVLNELETIEECAVVGIEIEEDNEIPIGFISSGDKEIDLACILEYVNTKLASYKSLKDIILIDKIPKLSTGKIDRKLLRQKYVLEYK